MSAPAATEPLFRQSVVVATNYRLFVERRVADDGTETITGTAIIGNMGAADPGMMDPPEISQAVADVGKALRCTLRLVGGEVAVADGKAVWVFERVAAAAAAATAATVPAEPKPTRKRKATAKPAAADDGGDMKIGALAPWYGSKRTLAPEIVRQLGPHRIYWEPFCGSCSVLFSKPRCTYETVNDLHQDLINLALVVQQEATAQELYGRVSRCLLHENLLPIAKKILMGRELVPEVPDVERAYWYLVFSWMGLNGISGTPLSHTGTFAVRYSGNGGNGATRWASVCSSIPHWHQRLVGVQILSRDAFEMIPRIDDKAGTAIYVDPPYLTKGAKYVHDFESVDHTRLAERLRRFEASRVVVSYYDDPRLEKLYPGWTKLSCGVAKAMVQGGRRDQSGRTEAPEVLLINGPAVTETTP